MIRGLYKAAVDPGVRSEWRWLVLRKVRDWVMPSYRIQWPYLDWWNDPWFNAYLDKFSMLSGANTDRRWMLYQLAKLARNVPGDTAECGVMAGSGSYLICSVLGRPHFMFDSFEGNSAPGAADGSYNLAGYLACAIETARANLSSFSNLSFHKGWIPDRFPDVADRRFCFVNIDVQLEQPTRDSLEFFYPRTNAGGLIVFDDYGFTTCPGARDVVDQFLKDKPEPIIETPCGNAFLIRSTG
jgi:O-methyltransferase